MQLNNIKAKHPASQIVAMDWGRGVAVVDVPAGGMAVVHFDATTLQRRGLQTIRSIRG
jgi:hypothetical protein